MLFYHHFMRKTMKYSIQLLSCFFFVFVLIVTSFIFVFDFYGQRFSKTVRRRKVLDRKILQQTLKVVSLLVYALHACLPLSFDSHSVDHYISTTCCQLVFASYRCRRYTCGGISFCHNSKIYLDLLVIAYNRIAWEMGVIRHNGYQPKAKWDTL